MRRAIWAVTGVLTLAALPGAQAANGVATPWVHVRVEESAKGAKVSVNLPMTVVEAMLKAAPDTVFSKGQIHLGHTGHHLSVADLRKAWKELDAVGDADLVTVEEKDETVTVARKGDLVQVRVQKPSEKEEVFVDVPTAVVEALLSGEGEELNIKAAVAELQKRRGDIVRVSDSDSKLRVWIDETNTGR